ncbi:MAG: thioredoxin domain-containing protein [Gammaproteobacteria bacterium]|nr:thioredoxin domain-containing protein [Gammaproteobacteria bacterium]MBQ0838785.1 thioredoxin domain-containing protein [Gammaproteobacteria bacterium]
MSEQAATELSSAAVPLQSLPFDNNAALSQQTSQPTSNAKPLPIDRQRDHIRGNIDAEFSLIEYSDFDCPFCRRFHPSAKRLIKDSAGRVNWVYRHFPLLGHQPAAQQMAEAAECAAELGGNTAFWRFTDTLVMQPKRGKKVEAVSHDALPTSVNKAAKSASIDTVALADCVKSGRNAARVKADADNAQNMGLLGTPANIIINNTTGQWLLRQGAVSLQTLRADIDSLSRPTTSQ